MRNFDEIDTRYGRFRIPTSGDIVSTALRTYGEWAQLEIDQLTKFISPGDTVYDIGGYLGTHTRAFSEHVGPEGRIVTFEASPVSFEFLTANIALGTHDNVLAFNKAAGDRDETLFLQGYNESNFGGAFVSSEKSQPDAVEVASVPLDDQDLPDPSLIKIDVEGAEARVLAGANRLIARSRPIIFAETNKLEGSVQVIEFAHKVDYRCFGSIEPAFNPGNFKGWEVDIYNGGAECGLILVPREAVSRFEVALNDLTPIETADDLSLLLLNKPQYALDLLVHLPSAKSLFVPTAELKEARLDLKRANETASTLAQELQMTSRRLEHLRSDARMLAKAAKKFPFSLYFKGRKKYRRIIRTLLGDVLLNPADLQTISQSGEYQLISDNFDRDFYRAKYCHSLSPDEDPVLHYMTTGWKEGFDPTPDFSTTYYLQSNLHVADLKIVPYLHYLEEGKQAGLHGRHPGGYKADLLHGARPFADTVIVGATGSNTAETSAEDLANQIVSAGGTPFRVVLSVSHDNFTEVVGGTQLCIQRECEQVQASGAVHVNIHPRIAMLTLAPEANSRDLQVVAVVNGTVAGLISYGDLEVAIRSVKEKGANVSVVLHQMLGHVPERISELVTATKRSACWVWLHDYFSICPGFNLLRNGISYCGAPPAKSQSCTICRYGTERLSHQIRIKTLFERIQPKVLSPSEATADIWRRRSGLSFEKIDIHPHVNLGWTDRETVLPLVSSSPVKVGFLGVPASHKGWDVFSELFLKHGRNGRFEFIYLGSYEVSEAMERKSVSVTVDAPNGMLDAVQDTQLDLVLHMAPWPETFAFTAFEALAGGAAILTNPSSGNVADLVEKTGRGLIFDNDSALRDAFDGDTLIKLARKMRENRARQTPNFTLSQMAVPEIIGGSS